MSAGAANDPRPWPQLSHLFGGIAKEHLDAEGEIRQRPAPQIGDLGGLQRDPRTALVHDGALRTKAW
jgi:hypothetical protein